MKTMTTTHQKDLIEMLKAYKDHWQSVRAVAKKMGRTWLEAVSLDLDRLVAAGALESRFDGDSGMGEFRFVPGGVKNPLVNPRPVRDEHPNVICEKIRKAKLRACPIPAFRRKPNKPKPKKKSKLKPVVVRVKKPVEKSNYDGNARPDWW